MKKARTLAGLAVLSTALACGSGEGGAPGDAPGSGSASGGAASSGSSGGPGSSGSSGSPSGSGSMSGSGSGSAARSSSGSNGGGSSDAAGGGAGSDAARDASSGSGRDAGADAPTPPARDAASDATVTAPVDAGLDAPTTVRDAGAVPDAPVASCPTTAATGTFAVTDGANDITVDTGGGLVFVVPKDNASISSLRWRGAELNDAAKASQIASGVAGTATSTLLASGQTSLVTVDCGTLVHYFATRAHENVVYMATFVTAEPSVGELRWITRLKGDLLTGVPAQSNNSGSTGNIESTDVFGYADGQSTSKFYGNQQARDLAIRGVTGSGVGVFMSYGSRESSSGGPFFRDIQNQSSTDADSELYNYMNSGHNQTQAVRTGVLYGPYALSLTTGCTPTIPDFGWMSTLNLQGWVAPAARGAVVGTGITGRDPRYVYTVGFDNPTAQYWVTADASTGAFAASNMKAGAYAMTVYKGELAVLTENVTVTAGGSASVGDLAITADPSAVAAVWRIGDWDGTPLEFRNGANLADMHPSDVRMSAWGPVPFVVGTNAPGDFPAVQFRGANSPTTIRFNLTAAQVASHTVTIGTTSAYAGGRPVITVNAFTSSTPPAPTQPDSRSVTIGTYRGNDTTYTYAVPASAFVAGMNTLVIDVASGSSDLGTWLSANWAYDVVELD
jgi:rhamnogalacturonan endolyase